MVEEPTTDHQWLTVKQFSAELNIAEITARTWISKSKVTSHKFGRAVRIHRSEIDRLICEGERPRAAQQVQ